MKFALLFVLGLAPALASAATCRDVSRPDIRVVIKVREGLVEVISADGKSLRAKAQGKFERVFCADGNDDLETHCHYAFEASEGSGTVDIYGNRQNRTRSTDFDLTVQGERVRGYCGGR